jgi:hypothetical protein
VLTAALSAGAISLGWWNRPRLAATSASEPVLLAQADAKPAPAETERGVEAQSGIEASPRTEAAASRRPVEQLRETGRRRRSRTSTR